MRTALYFAAALLLLSACIALLAAPASALPDSLYVAMPNGTVKCFEIVLPDDSGIILKGEIEYRLRMEPGPLDTWSDLSDQVIRTDENNTVKIPVCFRSFGRKEGECAKPFILSISSLSTPGRSIQGGVCVSKYQDIDTGTAPKAGETAVNALSDNADIFSMSFQKPLQYATPGSVASFVIDLESYASITVDISMESNATVSPARYSLSTSRTTPKRQLNLTVTAPQTPGEYAISAEGKIRNCAGGGYCSKLAKATLVVQGSVPEQAGFSLYIVPYSLNVKELEPVLYELTITNNGPAGTFQVSAELPEGLSSAFQPQSVFIGQGDSKIISLTATPGQPSSFYEMKLTASKDGISKTASAYLSTNELLTDAMREADSLRGQVDAATEGDIDDSLDGFYRKYRDAEYGEELEDYSDLKASLAAAKDKAGQQPITPTTPGAGGQASGGLDFTIVIIIVAVIAAGGIAAFFLAKRKGGKEESSLPKLERY